MTKEKIEKKLRAVRITARMTGAFYFFFWIFLLLAFRLAQLQILEARRFEGLAAVEHTEKVSIPAVRGNIYDRTGELLAVSTRGYSIAAVPQKISNPTKTAEVLSNILKMPVKDIFASIHSQQSFSWIRRKVDADLVEQVRNLRLPGIEIVEEPTGKRVYPKEELACHVLGYTGVDDQGLDGIELYYDKELRGNPGYFFASVDGLGRVMPDGVSQTIPAVSGANIMLTLDESVQYLAESELQKCVKEHGAKSGSIIVMNPANGEIFALASVPEFDGNHYDRYPDSIRRDRAVSDDYEPGSTFKAILAAAALDSGKVTMEERFLASPSIQVGGWQIHNADDGLTPPSPFANIQTIIQNSLNVGAASIALRIGPSDFFTMIRRFGFAEPTGIDLPGEGTGIIPDSRGIQPAELATTSFGQGIAVTPIQMARAYAMIANGGYPVRPHLLKRIEFSDGRVMSEPDGKSAVPIINSQIDDELKYLLSLVVENGTGTEARVPDYSTAGKTGTAQVSENGRYLTGQYVASFIGFVPVAKPAFVILVKIDEPRFPYWGGTVSAPIFKRIAGELVWHYEILPTSGILREGNFESSTGF